MPAGLALTFAAALAAQAVSGPTTADAPTVAFVERVAGSTTQVWTAAFAAKGLTYRPPRFLFLRAPAGHPSRGNGYSAGIGVLVDLDDLRGLREIDDPEARSIAAVIVAHEVGHHVQHLLAKAGGEPAEGLDRELQADCYAGWWLGQARRDPFLADLRLPGGMDDLSRRMSRALQILNLLERGGLTLRRDVAGVDLHGEVEQRVMALKQGLQDSDPWRC